MIQARTGRERPIAEIQDAETLRRYTKQQLLLLIPLFVSIIAIVQELKGDE